MKKKNKPLQETANWITIIGFPLFIVVIGFLYSSTIGSKDATIEQLHNEIEFRKMFEIDKLLPQYKALKEYSKNYMEESDSIINLLKSKLDSTGTIYLTSNQAISVIKELEERKYLLKHDSLLESQIDNYVQIIKNQNLIILYNDSIIRNCQLEINNKK